MTVAIDRWGVGRTPRRWLQFSQKKRLPVGELARERASLQQEYLSQSKELSALTKNLEQKNSEKIRECVGQAKVASPNETRVTAFHISQNTSQSRKKSASEHPGEDKLICRGVVPTGDNWRRCLLLQR